MNKGKLNNKKISVKEVNAYIEEEMTIRKLFTSSKYLAGLNAILQSSTSNLFIPCSLIMEWGKKEDFVAYTDGAQVHINGNNSLSSSFKNLPYRSLSIKGLLAHELGHILFSNFQLLREYNESFMAGEIYGEDNISHPNLKKVKEVMQKNPLSRNIIAQFACDINNLLEDIYIESKMILKFPGALKSGIICNNERLGATSLSVDKQLSLPNAKIPIVIINGLIQALKSQTTTYGNNETVKNYLTKLVPICRRFCFMEDPKVRLSGATYVILEIFPLLEEFIEELAQQQQSQQQSQQQGSSSSSGSSASSNPTSSNSNEAGNESKGNNSNTNQSQSSNSSNQSGNESKTGQQNQGQSQSQGQTNNNGSDSSESSQPSKATSKASSNLTAEEEEKVKEAVKKMLTEQLEQKTAQPKGYNRPQKSSQTTPREQEELQNALPNSMGNVVLDDSVSAAEKVAGKRKITFNKKFIGGGYDREEEKLKKILFDTATNNLIAKKEKSFSKSLEMRGKNTHLKGIHQGVNIKINRDNSNNLPSKAEYQDYLKMYNIDTIVKKASKVLKEALKAETFEEEKKKQYSGNRFSPKDAYRPDKRIFAKTHQPNESQDVSVSLMIDNSGSMSGPRIHAAKRTAVFIYEFCKSVGVPITIMGHTTGSGNEINLFSYVDADSFDGMDGCRLLTMHPCYCNRDGAAIRFACERLQERPEAKKLFIIISDGQPNDGSYYGEAAYRDLNNMKREFSRQGVEFIAAAIGDDKERIKKIYGNSYLDIDELSKLPKKLAQIISRKVLE